MRVRLTPLAPDQLDHELIWSLVGLVAMGGVIAWERVLGFGGFPVCTFHLLTGQPCMTCGSTRALVALGHFDGLAAFRLNPLISLVWAAWLVYVPYGLTTSLGRLRRIRISLTAREGFILRFAIPLAGLANWFWLIVDGR